MTAIRFFLQARKYRFRQSIFIPFLCLLLLTACSTPASTKPHTTPSSNTASGIPSLVLSIEATPDPTRDMTPFPFFTSAVGSNEGIERIPSPDGNWTAVLNRDAGSLDIESASGDAVSIFTSGSTASGATWSPDSTLLAVALGNRLSSETGGIANSTPEVWLVKLEDNNWAKPQLIYKVENSTERGSTPDQIILGAWSPNSRRILFWTAPMSASIQVDGLPLWCLEIEARRATRLADASLVNPTFQSWAPDGSALTFTDGGYRSAQVKKWLSLYQVALRKTTTLIPENVLVPGQLAWSPAGGVIAFAAVGASRTGEEWADWMSWENPAILARRIYLLDPRSGQYHRLNATEAYQDAPRWSADGKKLYYVQADGSLAKLMEAEPTTGIAQPLPGCQMPLPPVAGYYGQVDWTALHEDCNGKGGASVTGQVIAGYGDHRPVPNLPLRIRQQGNDHWGDTYTDGEGFFTLTHVPVGHVYIDDDHLTFHLTIDSPTQSINLGKLKYLLLHPPDYYWWQAAPLADWKDLLDKGVSIDFKVCAADSAWTRPDFEIQRQQVYSQPSFAVLDNKTIERFERIALLYDTVDMTQQNFPGGLNLDGLGADWLYLSGLWTASPNPLLQSECSYSPGDLQSLFDRSQLEVWLFGYKAIAVHELDKENIQFASAALCNTNDRTCTIRPADHFTVEVAPASGFQIIRFAVRPDVLAVHIIESGKELLRLP